MKINRLVKKILNTDVMLFFEIMNVGLKKKMKTKKVKSSVTENISRIFCQFVNCDNIEFTQHY